jgi:AraC-like DNA-binding protein
MEYVSIAGIVVIGVFLAFILSKRQKGRVDYLLITFNVLLACFIGLNAIPVQRISTLSIIAQNALPFFIFPVFAFMVLYTIYPDKKVSRYWYLLLLPGILFLMLTSSDHLLRDFSKADLLDQYNNPPLLYHFFFKGFQITILATLFYLIKQMQIYQSNIKNSFSYVEPIDVDWLRNFSLIYFVVVALSMIIFLISNFQLLPIKAGLAFAIVNGCLVLAVFYMNYQGIKHYTISQYYRQQEIEVVADEPRTQENTTQKAMRATRVNPKEAQRLYTQITHLFEKDELFLEPTIKLNEVADAVNETPHAVSEVINTVGKQSFFDFVNSYRVSRLKSILKDPTKSNLTILALGLESGFNSKASINRIFKNATGMTPLQFQKQD